MKTPKLEELTLREKIGQTVIFRQSFLKNITDLEDYFSKNPVGFIWATNHPKTVYSSIDPTADPEALSADEMYVNTINAVNRYLRIPVVPVGDASKGIPQSILPGHGSLPSMAGLGATKDPELAYRYGKCLGEDAHSVGYRWIWSPVADNSGKANGIRSITSDTELNCKMLSAFIRGMQDAGVAACAKHFPGKDPYDYRDSHFCTAAYTETLEYWEKTQKREFQACIDAGVASIMVSHHVFRAVDDQTVNGVMLPCILSEKVITGLIKEDMGFDGVVLTDDVAMKGITAIYPQEKLYVELLRAGVDAVLGPTRMDYIDIVEAAVLSGDLPESRIDDACRRILRFKEKYGLFTQGELKLPTEEQRAAFKANFSALDEEIAAKALPLLPTASDLSR